MFSETKNFLLANLGQVTPTRNYLKYIARGPSIQTDSCRYEVTQKTTQHLTGVASICEILYKERHDLVSRAGEEPHLGWSNPILKIILQPVQDFSVLTDQWIIQNRPDLILIERKL